jgi:Mn-dependent DtxR family transcriptional regulator
MSPAIPDDLPEDVIRFIADYIDSVPQIEALILLGDNPARAWTGPELADRIYVSAALAVDILSHLERRKLVVVAATGGFQFNTAGPDATLFPKVAATYRRHLARVAGMIHSKASLGVLEFARAFRIKKES